MTSSKKKRKKKAPKGEDSYCHAQHGPQKQVFVPSSDTVVSDNHLCRSSLSSGAIKHQPLFS